MRRNKLTKLLLSLAPLASLATVFLPSCSYGNIVVANFESYMSQDLMDQLKDDYQCQFLYYDTNETIETKFEKNYDIAIPSSYEAMILKKKGQLQQIDWSKFEMKDPTTGAEITNAKQAKGLFTDTINDVLDAQDKYYQEEGYLDSNETVLDYCIPYFLQSWMFAYTGDEITEFNDASTWDQVAQIMSTNDRFKPGQAANIACVDDSRTIYGMSKLIYDQQKYPSDSSKWNINPSTENQSIAQYEIEYDSFVKYFGPRYFYFNSDSNQILLSLADPKGVKGALCYNGDALYALTGGGIEGWEELWGEDNFFAIMPQETVLTLDMLVFNKKDENTEKNEQLYEIAKTIALEGGGYNENIAETVSKEDDSYVYGPMINFDFVMYTAPLKNLDDYVMGVGKYGEGGEYYEDYGSYVDDLPEKQQELFRKMYEITLPDNAENLFEHPLSDLDKSNMHWAYEPEKEKL